MADVLHCVEDFLLRMISLSIEPEYVIKITLPRILYLKSSGTVVSSVERKLIRLLSFIREFQFNWPGHSIKQDVFL